MNYLILFISLFNFTHATEWPKPEFETCEYYHKLDQILGCSAKGHMYLTEYASVYCKKFKKRSLTWTPKEVEWTKKTGLCLQEMLRDNYPQRLPSCRQLEEFAFDTHPICYKQYGVCDLPLTSQFKILNTVRFVDFLNRKSLGQVLNVGLKCFRAMISPNEEKLTKEMHLISKRMNRDEREVMGQFFLKAPVTNNKLRSEYFNSALLKVKSIDK